jgi:outer membrane receptor for monomeric catechols
VWHDQDVAGRDRDLCAAAGACRPSITSGIGTDTRLTASLLLSRERRTARQRHPYLLHDRNAPGTGDDLLPSR